MTNEHTTKANLHATAAKVTNITKTTDPKNVPIIAASDYSQYEGKGFESHTQADYAVPFLGVLQSNSPQIESRPSARPGMLMNTVTTELYEGKKGIGFIPVDTQHTMAEWKPRDSGGGFVKQHSMDSELVKKVKEEQEFGKYKTIKGDPKSNDLIETFSVFGIFVNDTGSSEQMIVSFSSSKIKVYKRWMTKARTVQIVLADGRRITPPLFAHKYRVTTVQEKNSKGAFYNFQIDYDAADAEHCRLATNDPLFQQAVAFYNLIKEGSIKAAYETQTSAHEDAEETTAQTPFK